jgi:hypothetical protein
VWQALRNELHPKGLEIVTVALDVDPEAARVWIEQTKPSHPSLIDSAHRVDELFGVVNVPNGVWIDENGIIVRPVEPAWPERDSPHDWRKMADSPDVPEQLRETLKLAGNIKIQAKEYVSALRDWVAKSSASDYALPPAEVIARSGPRGTAEAQAAAYFELGRYLWDNGRRDLAPRHWREAHRLQPDLQATGVVARRPIPGTDRTLRFVLGRRRQEDWSGELLSSVESVTHPQVAGSRTGG